MGQLELESSRINMSDHLHLLVSLLVFFDVSYTAFIPFVDQQNTMDIIKQTRTQANALMNTLRTLAKKPEASPILDKVFSEKGNDCIKNMDEAIEAIETSTKLFENAGDEIKLLLKKSRLSTTLLMLSGARLILSGC